jgi:hypothetical protein
MKEALSLRFAKYSAYIVYLHVILAKVEGRGIPLLESISEFAQAEGMPWESPKDCILSWAEESFFPAKSSPPRLIHALFEKEACRPVPKGEHYILAIH